MSLALRETPAFPALDRNLPPEIATATFALG